jgi:CRISPR-associated protein Cmr5
MTMATLEQERARFALDRIVSLAEVSGPVQAKYKSQLLKLPARLHTSGLGQSVAFYLAAGAGSPEAEICGWIESWLAARLPLGERSLLDCITGAGTAAGDAERIYREASAEARALVVWLKRFAEAFLAERPARAGADARGADAAGAAAAGAAARGGGR